MFAIVLALLATASALPEHEAHRQLFGHLTPTAEAPRMPRGAATPGPDHTVYGYQAYWAADLNAVPWDDLTHLAIFSANVNPDGTLGDTNRWDDAATAVAMGAPYDVRVHLCITNFNTTELATLLSNSAHRATLVTQVKAWVDGTGAHGVNVDFESLPSSERSTLVTFIRELEAADVGDIVLATPAVDWSDAWDYSSLTDHADLFIMGYGYHWSGGNPGPLDPIYGGGIWAAWSLDWSVNDYVTTNGADPERIILGLPLYGREWPVVDPSALPGERTGDGAVRLWKDAWPLAETHGREWDAHTSTPFWRTSTTQGFYGDLESLRARVRYADDVGIQGIGFWALHYDDNDPDLWQMIREEYAPEPGDTGDTGEPGSDTLHADAGLPFLAYVGDTIILDGTGSSAPGTPTFEWSQVAGPDVTLLDADGPNPTFRVTTPGTHIFELVVGDGTDWSAPDRSHVVVLDPTLAGGCGCQSSAPFASLWLLGLIPWIRRRR
ncbi:MAG: hypothetical protein KC912_08400 [Proteobacteria bacterium]|nr:hypothetical protein [Pseudomonadota bacterium]